MLQIIAAILILLALALSAVTKELRWRNDKK